MTQCSASDFWLDWVCNDLKVNKGDLQLTC